MVNNKTPLNVSGKYYVNDTCICCGICTIKAPQNIAVSLMDEIGYFYKQPENMNEENLCYLALIACPVHAIGNDGIDLR